MWNRSKRDHTVLIPRLPWFYGKLVLQSCRYNCPKRKLQKPIPYWQHTKPRCNLCCAWNVQITFRGFEICGLHFKHHASHMLSWSTTWPLKMNWNLKTQLCCPNTLLSIMLSKWWESSSWKLGSPCEVWSNDIAPCCTQQQGYYICRPHSIIKLYRQCPMLVEGHCPAFFWIISATASLPLGICCDVILILSISWEG